MDREKLIEKWLKDELTDAEKQAFSQLDDAAINETIIDNAQYFKADTFSKVDDFNVFENRYNSTKNSTKSLNWRSPFLRIAAVLVVALGLYFTLFSSNNIHIETLANEKTQFELPDQSQVTLNALSQIEYDDKAWSDNRSLKLRGEAYFKVAKGKVFDVITKDGIVTVVGTEFNVKQRENYFEVTCFEGTVKVTRSKEENTLQAGDSFLVLNNELIQSTTLLPKPDWTENRSSFKAIPFAQVLAEVERQYNIEITYSNSNINRLFTGSFTHNNLDDALKSITLPMNMTYEISTTNLVVIHGNKD